MDALTLVITILQLLCGLAIIVVVLFQSGKSAGLSGAIAGVVGFLLVSGANNTLYSGVAAGAGFTAITVAWLAQLNPFAMIGISALLAVLEKGADTLQTRMNVPASISDIITGIFLFCMLGCEFFINYRLILRGGHKEVTGA